MISVCMASYNGAGFIERQILSILNQLSENDELIISDDSSQDETINIIKSLNDSRIKILNGNFHSPTYNFENALSKAKGDYIFLTDQDDQWLPNKVETCLNYLQEYDCIVSDCFIVDKNLQIINSSFYKKNRTKTGKFYNLLVRNGYLGCCMAFNRKVLEKSLPFPKNIPLHDLWIGNVAAFGFSLQFVPEKLIYYCRHGDNASPAGGTSNFPVKTRILNRLYVINNLVRYLLFRR